MTDAFFSCMEQRQFKFLHAWHEKNGFYSFVSIDF